MRCDELGELHADLRVAPRLRLAPHCEDLVSFLVSQLLAVLDVRIKATCVIALFPFARALGGLVFDVSNESVIVVEIFKSNMVLGED